MTFEKLSKKQRQIFKWPYKKNSYALICDGSVRSGKTAAMTCSFVHWAMKCFTDMNFAICGNTVQAAERNIVNTIQQMTDITYYYHVKYNSSKHILVVSGGGHVNYFYVFGGKDEGSYKLIQGLTLAGVLFDEVALQPESFVDQAIARTLSVNDARIWFNCNPDGPEHWFNTQWIRKAVEKHAERVHFTMEDNPIMSPEKIERTKSLFSGVFYDRYVLGKWAVAEGLVYPMFDRSKHIGTPAKGTEGDYYISIDYGTVNPTSMGLWLLGYNNHAYRIKEYYYDARKEGVSRTDEEHYAELDRLAGDLDIVYVIVDPSAASFIECIRRHGKFRVRKADNSVLDGIRDTSTLLQLGYLHFSPDCADTIREFSLYCWDTQGATKKGPDAPVKQYDHAMDDMRYFVESGMKRALRELRSEEMIL